jgi:hypothetical protein
LVGDLSTEEIMLKVSRIAVVLLCAMAGACRAPGNGVLEQAAGGGGCTIVVATTGSDSGLGTLASPFATLDHARDVVRTLVPSASSPINVCLRGGTYSLSHTFTLGPQDSGTGSAPVTYLSYPGERAVLSGGVQLNNLNWKPYTANIYVASVNRNFNQLFVNGQRATRARSPNYDGSLSSYYRMTEVSSADRSAQNESFLYQPGSVPSGLRNSDMEIVSMERWAAPRQRVASTDATTLTVQGEVFGAGFATTPDDPQPPRYGWDPSTQDRYYVENALSAVDAPGEWYLDENMHLLYYYPRDLGELSTGQFIVPRVHQLVRGGTYKENQGWDYIATSYTSPPLYMVRSKCRHLGVYPEDPFALGYGGTSFSVALWVRLPSGATEPDPGWVFEKGDPIASQGYGLKTSSTDATVPITFYVNDGTSSIATTAATAPRDTWVHVAFVVDRASGKMTAYYNGALTSSVGISSLGSIASNLPLDVGAYTNLSCSLSAVDDLLVYGRALSSVEIASLAGGGAPPASQLDLWLPFDNDYVDHSPNVWDTVPYYPPLFGSHLATYDAVDFRELGSRDADGTHDAYRVDGAVDHIGFSNIDFEYTDWAFPYTGYVGSENGMGQSAVYLHSHYANLSGNGFYHHGSSALGGLFSYSTIGQNTFSDIGGGAIAIGENLADEADLEKMAPYSSQDTIFSNAISDTGLVTLDETALRVAFGMGTQILYNSIARAPHVGIAVGGNGGSPNFVGSDRIAYNDVSFVMQQLNDGAGIYVNGSQPGAMIDHNIVYDIRVNPTSDPHTYPNVINGIYLDGGAEHFTVRDNLVYRTEIGILVNDYYYGTGWNVVTNNIFVDGAAWEFAYCSSDDDAAYTNIFYDGQATCPDLYLPYYDAVTHEGPGIGSSKGNLFYFRPRSCPGHDLSTELDAWKTIRSSTDPYEVCSLSGVDPQFVDYAHDNFALEPTSPALLTSCWGGIGFTPIDFTGVPHYPH